MDVADLQPIALDRIIELADLQSRTDRKYLVRPDVGRALVEAHPDLLALDMHGLRRFGYESTYFDTDDLTSYHGAAHGRRRRFKVRTRAYLESHRCTLEIKTRGPRGQTVKTRHSHRFVERAELTPEGYRPVREQLGPLQLSPQLRVSYTRSTLVDVHGPFRVAIDSGLTVTDLGAGLAAAPGETRIGRTARLDGLVVVETKSPGPPTTVDRWLWRNGSRPVRFSKYCAGLAALRPELPANRWQRSLSCFSVSAPSIRASPESI